jgi:hypothetical protein
LRSTRPVLVVVAADAAAAALVVAGTLRVAAPETPFFIVPIPVRVGTGAAAVLVDAVVAVPTFFLTTVDVLPSLDSLMPLTLCAVREGAAARAAAVVVVAAPRRVVLEGPAAAELAVEDVVALRVAAAALVDRAFSTMLLMMLPPDAFFTGDGGRGGMCAF